jgi:hypothetical protein
MYVLGLLLFDLVCGFFAISPSLGTVEPTATLLHVTIAAINTAVLGRLIGAAFPAVYLTFSMCVMAESIQVFSDGRTASVSDLLAGGIGISFGLAILAAMSLYSQMRSSALPHTEASAVRVRADNRGYF